jgi:ferritin-like metal-binding protein YciE
MVEKTTSPQLRDGFNLHIRQTEGQVRRLDRIFDELGDKVKRDGKKCKGMEGIIKEGEEIVKADGEPEVRDAHTTLAVVDAIRELAGEGLGGVGDSQTQSAL